MTYNDLTASLPSISEGKKVAVAYSGDVGSTLLAKAAVDKYGSDYVVLITFMDLVGNKVSLKSANKLTQSINALYELSIPPSNHKIYSSFNFKAENKLEYLRKVEVKLYEEYQDVERILFGFNKLFFDVEPLLGMPPFKIAEYLESNPAEMEDVIKTYHVESEEDWLKEITFNNKTPEVYEYLRTSTKTSYPLKELTEADIFSLYNDAGLLSLLSSIKSCSSFLGAVEHKHCGECHNCQIRKDSYAAIGVEDPTDYFTD